MEENYWNLFESTGKVTDYLNYCRICKNSTNQEELPENNEKKGSLSHPLFLNSGEKDRLYQNAG